MKSQNTKDQKITVGSIVTTKSHPYSLHQQEVKIAAYNHFTPPTLIVTEVNYSRTYEKESGDRKPNSYNAIYYNTNVGNFEYVWFQEKQLKLLQNNSEEYEKYKDLSLEKLKKDLINKTAILKTVDIELGKTQVFYSSSQNKLNQKGLLDFLPPLGTIIQVIENKEITTYNEKTGKPATIKTKYSVKLRYYNNKKFKFSEDEVPLSAIKIVNVSPPSIPVGLCWIKDKNIEIPSKFEAIHFKHYKYELQFKNLLSNESFFVDNIKNDILDGPDKNFFLSDETMSFDKIDKPESLQNSWIQIIYLDLNKRSTSRIVYVKEFISSLFITICTLRNGSIRHFHKDRIIGWRIVPKTIRERLQGFLDEEY